MMGRIDNQMQLLILDLKTNDSGKSFVETD